MEATKTLPTTPAKMASDEPAPPPTDEADDDSQIIQVDPNYGNDSDSTMGSETDSSTASVSASILKFRKIHGRTFHNFTTGTEYWGPNDAAQNDTLDIVHHMLFLARNNRLFMSPIGDNPQRVLDVGTGTGIWCIDFADQYPSAAVIGTDLSPIQPLWVPPNCKFELDDAQLEWTYPENHFDLIHIRFLMGSIKDWGELYRQAYRCLKPGGWIEHFDLSIHAACDDGSMREDCVWHDWARIFKHAGEYLGRTFNIIENSASRKRIAAAGFVNVHEEKSKLPIGGWPKNKKWKLVGEYHGLATEQALEGYALYLLTTVYGWTFAEVQTFVAKARAAVKDKSIHAYLPGSCVYGQKPVSPD